MFNIIGALQKTLSASPSVRTVAKRLFSVNLNSKMPVKVIMVFFLFNIPFVLLVLFPQVGDYVPSVDLYENTPANKINLLELCNGKTVILFAVPGAFTPGCSKVT